MAPRKARRLVDLVRHPAAAGHFYPADPDALRQTIAWCYRHAMGPGQVPAVGPEPIGGVAGFVVPHAAYQYSGPVAAHAFHRVAALGSPSVIVILGPNHYGAGRPLALSPWEQWNTPLGALSVDARLGETLAAGVPGLAPDLEAHVSEHSLEVQLPFLRHLYGSDASIVPISMADQSLETAQLLGKEMARVLSGKSALVLASSDFSHHLPDSEAREEDRRTLQAITSLDAERLADVLERRGVNMCGCGPVMAMLVALVSLGASDARVLSYATSGDISGVRSSVVGYGAVEVTAQPSG